MAINSTLGFASYQRHVDERPVAYLVRHRREQGGRIHGDGLLRVEIRQRSVSMLAALLRKMSRLDLVGSEAYRSGRPMVPPASLPAEGLSSSGED